MSGRDATNPAERLVASLEESPFCRVGADKARLLFSKHARDRHGGAVSLLIHVLRQRAPHGADCFDDPMQLILAASSVFKPALAWGRLFSVCTRHAALLMRRGGQLETFQPDQISYAELMNDGAYTSALLESAATTEANGALQWQLDDELCAFAYGVQAWMSQAVVQHASSHVVSDHSLVFICDTKGAVQATIPDGTSQLVLDQLQHQRDFFAVSIPSDASARDSHAGGTTRGTCGRLASMRAMQDGAVLAWYLAAHSNMLLREVRAIVPRRAPKAKSCHPPPTGSDLQQTKRRRESSVSLTPSTERPRQPSLAPPVASPVALHPPPLPLLPRAPDPDTSLDASVLQDVLGRIMEKIDVCLSEEEKAVAVELIDFNGMDARVQVPLFVNMMPDLQGTPDAKLSVLLQSVFAGAEHETTREFFEAAAYTFKEVQREITRTFLLRDREGGSFCALHPTESPLHMLGSGVSNTVYGIKPASVDADEKHAALCNNLSNLLNICGHGDLYPGDLAIRVPSFWVASTKTELVEIARIVVQYAFAASRDVGVQLVAAYIFPLSQLVDASALETWDPQWNEAPPNLPVYSNAENDNTEYGLMLVTRRMRVSIGVFSSVAVEGDEASLCDDIRSMRGEALPLLTCPNHVDGLLDCIWSMLERMALSGVAVVDFHMGNMMLIRKCHVHPDGSARIVDFDARFSTIFSHEEVSKGVLPIFLLNALRMLSGLACDRNRRPLLNMLLRRLRTRALPHRMQSEADGCAYDIVSLTDHVIKKAIAAPENERSIAQRLLMIDWRGGFQNTGVTVLSSMYGNPFLCKLVHHASYTLSKNPMTSTTDAVNDALRSQCSSARDKRRDWTYGDLSSLTQTAYANKLYENVTQCVWTKAYELQTPKFSSSAVATFEHLRFAMLLCTQDVYVSQPLTHALRYYAHMQRICEVHAQALLKANVGPGVVNVEDVLTSGALNPKDHATVADAMHLLTDMFVNQPHVGLRVLLPPRKTPMPLAQAYASMVVARSEPTAHALTVTVLEKTASCDDPWAPIKRTTFAPPQAFFGF